MIRRLIVFNSVRLAVVLLGLLTALALLPGCSEKSPQAPEVIIEEDDTDALGESSLIPSGAKFFSATTYWPSPVIIDQFGSPNTRIVISRIDYRYADPLNDFGICYFLSNSGDTVSTYRIYSPYTWGTIFLTYPIEEQFFGGGLGFAFGTLTGEVYKFSTGYSTEATIFGYTYTP